MRFENEYAFLSNFYPSPIEFLGQTCPTAEHFFQALKAEKWEDAISIIQAPTPGLAKKMGRKVTMRKDWEDVKVKMMCMVVKQKFVQNPELAKKLIDLPDEKIIETNYWGDTFWGVCEGKGRNWLGKILMEVRSYLRKQEELRTNNSEEIESNTCEVS